MMILLVLFVKHVNFNAYLALLNQIIVLNVEVIEGKDQEQLTYPFVIVEMDYMMIKYNKIVKIAL